MTPGEGEVASRELRQADEAFQSAKLLIAAGHLASGTSRLYYAAFHAARAALTVRGLYSRTHSGLIGLYAKTFGSASQLQELFRLRQLADYSTEPFELPSSDLDQKIQETSVFMDRCTAIVSEALSRGPDQPDPPPDL